MLCPVLYADAAPCKVVHIPYQTTAPTKGLAPEYTTRTNLQEKCHHLTKNILSMCEFVSRTRRFFLYPLLRACLPRRHFMGNHICFPAGFKILVFSFCLLADLLNQVQTVTFVKKTSGGGGDLPPPPEPPAIEGQGLSVPAPPHDAKVLSKCSSP